MSSRPWRLVVAAGLVGLLASGTAPSPVDARRAAQSSPPTEPVRLAPAPHPDRPPDLGELLSQASARRVAEPPPASRPLSPRPPWAERIDDLVGTRPVSVAVGIEGAFLYRLRAGRPRPPASNQKLLLSMALLEEVGPRFRIPTVAATEARVEDGVLRGDLWILGRGDPEVDRGRLRTLAVRIHQTGIRTIHGSVVGGKEFFRRDWWAQGWQPFHPGTHISLPTALTFEGNGGRGNARPRPELRAAAALVGELEEVGVRVLGSPGAGRPPLGLVRVAAVRSPPLVALLARQNVASSNFHAEVLTKLLGARAFGEPGSLAKGARAIQEHALGAGVHVVAHDGSGLSYTNEVGTGGMVRLLWDAEGEPWGPALRRSLPRPGEGTLRGRLAGVRARAKTGTILIASGLSGWVWLERQARWAAFSILSNGLPKHEAASLEDAILRIVAGRA